MFDSPFLFVHIPKTAGTSFRAGLYRYIASDSFYSGIASISPAFADFLGRRKMIHDYGSKSHFTHPYIAKRTELTDEDLDKLNILINKTGSRGIVGHFSVSKYRRLFDNSQIATFVRDPVDRVISEYFHSVAHHNYRGELIDFAQQKGQKNRQFKLLYGVDIETIGFLGITESYNDSMALLRKQYGVDIPVFRQNVRDEKLKASEISSFYDDIYELNNKDVELYNQCLSEFQKRKDLYLL